MSDSIVPIIDVSPLFGKDQDQRVATAQAIGKACREIGFIVIVGHQVEKEIIDNAWAATRNFFDEKLDYKTQYIKPQDEYPFGYSEVGGEVLSAGKAAEEKEDGKAIPMAPPDLKEMFSIGPKNPKAGFPERLFPTKPAQFADAWTAYYDTLASLAREILRAFAMALDLDNELYFDQFIDHHASALRAINYPAVDTSTLLPGQLRASAHTDYGTMTILKSDGPGLQVSKDVQPPTWYDVPHISDGFIINLGDLMRRWTNDRWVSTLHRVVIPTCEVSAQWTSQQQPTPTSAGAGTAEKEQQQEQQQGEKALAAAAAASPQVKRTQRRQSMAFFHNLNKDAEVAVILRRRRKRKEAGGGLEEDTTEAALYKPIIAGDFLMQKHLASMKAAGAGAGAGTIPDTDTKTQ
mmetsp:Transcript_4739/g.7739  ORF Transcript_4739/g.7739 Transcript_4739/m.7739 type:complete len:406 (+) Transcript_4739:35-1252(+)